MITITKHIFVTSLVIILMTRLGVAQVLKSDTILVDTAKTKQHSPTKATIMSLVVPGLGQVYNKKYWKLPIIYGGIGTSLYFAFSNNKEYNRFRSAYLIRIDDDVNTIDEFEGILTDANIKVNMDVYQRNRDFSYIIAGLIYVFNVVDATVDAHLFTFPVNDNLTFHFQPSMQLTDNKNLSKGFSLIITL